MALPSRPPGSCKSRARLLQAEAEAAVVARAVEELVEDMVAPTAWAEVAMVTESHICAHLH